MNQWRIVAHEEIENLYNQAPEFRKLLDKRFPYWWKRKFLVNSIVSNIYEMLSIGDKVEIITNKGDLDISPEYKDKIFSLTKLTIERWRVGCSIRRCGIYTIEDKEGNEQEIGFLRVRKILHLDKMKFNTEENGK